MFNVVLHVTTSCCDLRSYYSPNMTQFPRRFLLISLTSLSAGREKTHRMLCVYPAPKSSKTNQKCSPQKCRVFGVLWGKSEGVSSPFPKKNEQQQSWLKVISLIPLCWLNNWLTDRPTDWLTTRSWHLQVCCLGSLGKIPQWNHIHMTKVFWNWL